MNSLYSHPFFKVNNVTVNDDLCECLLDCDQINIIDSRKRTVLDVMINSDIDYDVIYEFIRCGAKIIQTPIKVILNDNVLLKMLLEYNLFDISVYSDPPVIFQIYYCRVVFNLLYVDFNVIHNGKSFVQWLMIEYRITNWLQPLIQIGGVYFPKIIQYLSLDTYDTTYDMLSVLYIDI
jgi:hypothetical protein